MIITYAIIALVAVLLAIIATAILPLPWAIIVSFMIGLAVAVVVYVVNH